MEEREIQYCGDSKKSLLGFPLKIRERFVMALEQLRLGEPEDCLSLKSKRMSGLGQGVTELICNGRPAYRCVYVLKQGELIVIHAFSKTSNGTDKEHEDTIKARMKNI